jgi:predicted transcriptional regulator of viral defense system
MGWRKNSIPNVIRNKAYVVFIPPPTPELVFITPTDLRKRYGDFDSSIFEKWQNQKLIRKLRDGLYLNESFKIECEVDQFMLANTLRKPSYISLLSALSYYSLIPEYVVERISVTTQSSESITLNGSRFRYHTIHSAMFWGYEKVPWRGLTYDIAYPEKALIDLAYLEPQFSDRYWIEEMRFDWEGIVEDLDWKRMQSFIDLTKSAAIQARINLLRDIFIES